MIPTLQTALLFALAAIAASTVSGFAPIVVRSTSHRHHDASSPATGLNMAGGDAAAACKYSKVFVAGGSRGVGRAVIDRLLSAGSQVVALVRTDEAEAELSALDGVTVARGDAFDYKAVEGAMDGCDAAVTTLGQGTDPVGEDGRRVDYVGNNNVIEAAGILGVTRVVLVTSIGCGSSKEAAPPSVFEVLRDTLAAKERAENVLIKYYTNMNWTIVRPGGLKSEPATGTAILTENNLAIGSVHREDVADLVVQALNSGNTERKILSAVDPEISASANAEASAVEAFALA